MATFTENLAPGINKYGYCTNNYQFSEWHTDNYLHVGLSDSTNLYKTFTVMQFTIPAYTYKYLTSARLYLYCASSGKCASKVDLLNYSGSLNETTFALYNYRDLLATASEQLPKNQSGWVSVNLLGIVESMRGQTLTIRIKSDGSVMSDPQEYSSSRGSNAPYIAVTGYDDVPVATPLDPFGTIVQKAASQTFKWRYFSNYGEAQYSYELGYREQGESTWTTVTAQTSDTQYSMSTLGLSTGVIEWRIKVFNPNSVGSEYAYATFELIGTLMPITITSVSSSAIPEITWAGDTSEVSKVQIRIMQNGNEVWNSGDLPGNISRTYKPNCILEDGNYICQMRAGNAYALWSDWSGLAFTTSPLIRNLPTITASPVDDYVVITTDTEGLKFLYRSEDGTTFKPVAKFSNLVYADADVKTGTIYTYYIKYVNGGSKNSDKATVVPVYKGYRIGLVSNKTNTIGLHNCLEKPFPVVSREIQVNCSFGYYVGRKNKVKESGVQKSDTMTGTFYLSEQDFNRLKVMIEADEAFMLKSKDDIMYCDVTISDASNAMFNLGYNVEIACERVYYDDEIRYNEE